MISLTDIAPAAPAHVAIRGSEVEVFGLGIGEIARLLGRFPEVKKLMTGDAVAVEDILSAGPEIVSEIIAIGCRVNDRERLAALNLRMEEQADILGAIIRETLPNGVDPFVQKLASLGVRFQPVTG